MSADKREVDKLEGKPSSPQPPLPKQPPEDKDRKIDLSSHAQVMYRFKPEKKLLAEKKEQQQGDKNWVLVKHPKLGSVFVHGPLFDTLGIAAFRGVYVNTEKLVGADYFSFNTRNLKFVDESKLSKKEATSQSKVAALTKQLQQFIDQRPLRELREALPPELREALPPKNLKEKQSKKDKRELKISSNSNFIVSLIQEYLADDREVQLNTTVVFNSQRREEAFWPLTVNKSSVQEQFGLHVYPWLSKSEEKFVFSGFEHVVTAMCMFGAGLKGVDQYGANFPLIKHDISFLNGGRQIVGIDIEKPNPYEAAQFADFEKLVPLVKNLSNSEKQPHLYCHLPPYDYILFNFVELFFVGKMTLEALQSAVQCILEERERYREKIEAICAEHGVLVTIFSPFDNLFGPSADFEEVMQVLEELQYVDDREAITEKDIVQNCLRLLTTQHLQEQQREVWEHFVQAKGGAQNITTIEELFKIGNASVIATVSADKPPCQVGSYLPLHEKQIQVCYAEFSKKAKPPYPAVVNVTYLQHTFFGYSHTNKGNSFYFDAAKGTVVQLIDHGILATARRNASTKPGNENHKPLQKFLQEFEQCVEKEPFSPSPMK